MEQCGEIRATCRVGRDLGRARKARRYIRTGSGGGVVVVVVCKRLCGVSGLSMWGVSCEGGQ